MTIPTNSSATRIALYGVAHGHISHYVEEFRKFTVAQIIGVFDTDSERSLSFCNRHKLRNINKILSYPHHYKKKELISIYSLLAKKIIYTKNVKEAETAKVIENIQRDVNIGLINEIYH